MGVKHFKILLAEDDELSRQNLVELLEDEGYEVKAVGDGKEAMEEFVRDKYHLVITDLRMPRADGLEVLKFVGDLKSEALVVIITGYGSVDSAVEAMKLGAFDYIVKPLKDDLVKLTVSRALSYLELKGENLILRQNLKSQFDLGKLIGYSECMKQVFEKVEKVARSDSTVLLHGESGTGKELVARAIHANSERRHRPLITVHCGAIPTELLESELFGHEKGSFTGAIRTKPGKFELAEGGTIFLDEIGDMSPALQVKLLRVIQEKQFDRVGGVKTLTADVRIIAATNQNLESLVKERKFREDLYYRINVIPIYLPPLRERGLDIPILANHFLKKFNQLRKKQVKRFSQDAIDAMLKYEWPGNVRELENLVEMLVVMKEEGEIGLFDLPEKMRGTRAENIVTYGEVLPEEGVDYNRLVYEFERDLLFKALNQCGGVKNKAAKLLKLNRTTLVEKLKRFGM
ncbi:MAG: sigma-54 dependent transcriptional regulator [Syntrophales bacterium]|nr:sigma-54 dependent transcriptional regulator [Syntrophales bacterium]